MSNQTTIDLAAVKVGDEVAWLASGRWYGSDVSLATVVRLTRTQIICETTDRAIEYRFRREDGRRIGDTGWGVYLLNPTDADVVEAVLISRARKAFYDVEAKLGKLPRIKNADEAYAVLVGLQAIVNTAMFEIKVIQSKQAREKRDAAS